MKIEGFDDLAKQLEEAQKATEALGGELGTIKFNAADPQDVQRAIKEAERIVDARLARYRNNPFVQQLAEGTKEAFRQTIQGAARKATGQ